MATKNALFRASHLKRGCGGKTPRSGYHQDALRGMRDVLHLCICWFEGVCEMKLQQLRYAVETFRCNLNVSEAAERLFTSQPGVSKQIRLLEDELGVQIFIRSGKRIVSVTPAGKSVLEIAERILRDTQQIKQIGQAFSQSSQGSLTIATTPTLARFRLPDVVARFLQQHGDVQLNVKQAAPDELAAMVLRGEVDWAISSQAPMGDNELRRLLCERWGYALLLPAEHELAQSSDLSLADIMAQPLLTYDYMLHVDAPLGRILARSDVKECRVALAANDVNVLQTYVRLGLGVGLVDTSVVVDDDLVLRDVSWLFAPDDVQILLRQDVLLSHYSYDFFEYFNADLTRERVDKLLYAPPIDDFSI